MIDNLAFLCYNIHINLLGGIIERGLYMSTSKWYFSEPETRDKAFEHFNKQYPDARFVKSDNEHILIYRCKGSISYDMNVSYAIENFGGTRLP